MTLPWILLFFLVLFVGLFLVVFYSMRSQDKALNAILQQQKSVRMEVERLADSLDALLADRELEDEDIPADPSPSFSSRPAAPFSAADVEKRTPEAVPGLDRLLLGSDTKGEAAKKPGSSSRDSGLPDLKF